MYECQIDEAANLLKIRYAGVVDAGQMRQCAQEIEVAVQKLHPGFRLRTDLSGLEQMDLACIPDIKKIMILCNRAGVQLVVRVIPDPHKDIGLNIMSLFHYRKRVRIVTCERLEEAQRVLEHTA